MSRINVVPNETANAEQKAVLDAIQSKLGMVPNFLKILANSPAALRAFLGLHGIASEGTLDPKTRERIAARIGTAKFLRILPICAYCYWA